MYWFTNCHYNKTTSVEAINVFRNQTEMCSDDKLDCAILSSHIKGKQSTQRKWRGIWCTETEKEGESSSWQQHPPTSSLPRVRMWVGNGGCRQNVGPRFFAAVCEKMRCCPLWSPLLGVCCGWPQWVPARSVNGDMTKHEVSSALQHTNTHSHTHYIYYMYIYSIYKYTDNMIYCIS